MSNCLSELADEVKPERTKDGLAQEVDKPAQMLLRLRAISRAIAGPLDYDLVLHNFA